MTVYYVGTGGNNANNGLSYATRKLTLNGAEDVPVVAGDTVYVSPGTYREMLTVDVSGSSGSPITYIGDYSGANTDGVGGVVRVTASDDDLVATRNSCIYATGKSYRTIQDFDLSFAKAINPIINLLGTHSNNIINKCHFSGTNQDCIDMYGSATNNLVQNCYFLGTGAYGYGVIWIGHSSTVDNSGIVVSNNIFVGGYAHLYIERIGGITCKNNTHIGGNYGIYNPISPAAGQTIQVNNSVFATNRYPFFADAADFIVENYNSVYASTTARTNVATGANSNEYPFLPDSRWFFEMVK